MIKKKVIEPEFYFGNLSFPVYILNDIQILRSQGIYCITNTRLSTFVTTNKWFKLRKYVILRHVHNTSAVIMNILKTKKSKR